MNESRYYPNCDRLSTYDYAHYNQLGHYHREREFKWGTPKYEVSQFEVQPFVDMGVNGAHSETRIVGDFNAFNVLVVYSVLKELGLNDDTIHKGFDIYTSNNGRMQYFKRGQKEAMINSTKNPVGMNVSLSVGGQLKGKKVYVISLNGNAADSRDTSRIYGADFEKLRNQSIEKVIITGTRVKESQLRLKPAEADVPIILKKDIYKAVALTMSYADFTVAIPSYTSFSPTLEQLNRSFVGGR